MRVRQVPNGFTLIELMVVVGIVAVISMFALPSMRDLLRGQRMKTTSLDIYMSLVMARSEAIKLNSGNVSMIAASGGWQNGWQVCVDANANGACDSSESLLIAEDPVDSTITLSGPAGNVITYNRTGRLATASASFTLTAGADNAAAPMRCVDVDVSGRPRTRVDSNHTDSDGCN
jgi:type IV fimbrial biogenesis protein FimT